MQIRVIRTLGVIAAAFRSRCSLVYVLPMCTAPFAAITNDSTTQVDDALCSAEG